jgi:hypothetical protein
MPHSLACMKFCLWLVNVFVPHTKRYPHSLACMKIRFNLIFVAEYCFSIVPCYKQNLAKLWGTFEVRKEAFDRGERYSILILNYHSLIYGEHIFSQFHKSNSKWSKESNKEHVCHSCTGLKMTNAGTYSLLYSKSPTGTHKRSRCIHDVIDLHRSMQD